MKETAILKRILTAVLAVVLAVGLAAAGCSSDNDPDPLLYATWQLQEFVLDDGTVITPDDPLKYTVTFNTDGTANIRSDCNSCSGRFSADDDSLSFGVLACTLAACASGSLDTTFQAALGTASDYNIETSLYLDYEGGTMRFLAPVATPVQ